MPTSPLVQMWIKTQTQNINNTNNVQKKYRLGKVSKTILLEGLNRFHGTLLNLNISSFEEASRSGCTAVMVFKMAVKVLFSTRSQIEMLKRKACIQGEYFQE